jgi:DegV family protein with EDD domain
MLHIVTDSAADMPLEWRKKYDVHFVPVNIHFGTEQFLHGVDMDETTFYKRVETVTDKTFPKTSQPNPHQFEQVWRRVAQKGDTILSINVTGKLSKTVESALAAANNVKDDFKVVVFDSLCGSAGIGYMCREAREMDRAGKNLDEIVKRLEVTRAQAALTITLATLKYAQMSGRVGGLRAVLGRMLNLQPIIALTDGVLMPTEDKVRVRGKALERIAEISRAKAGGGPCYLSVVHAACPEDAQKLAEIAQRVFNVKDEVVIQPLSVAVAIQLGPGTVGCVAYPAA